VQVIPVIDLKGGQVVRAQGGRRDSYRRIVTPLSASADPSEVMRGLKRLHPFRTFYVADLDAIEGRAEVDLERLERLRAEAGEIWIDAGFRDEPAVRRVLEIGNVRAVIGTESQADSALIRGFRHNPRVILSLDFFADGYCGPEEIVVDPALWPRDVIVMTLAKVGSGQGPDFERLASIMARAPGRRFIAAGGVRDGGHLCKLADMGVAGVLVASALHDGTVTAEDLSRYA
jgi:Uncharacterized protein related to proFAR isomerase (HisA)